MDMDLTTFLDLVSNADKYKAKLKELTDHEAHIKKLASQLGTLSEANALKVQAQQLLDAAKIEVNKMISDAKKAEQVRKELIDGEFKAAADQKRIATDIRNQGNNALAKAEAMMKEILEKERNLNQTRALLEAQQAETLKKQAELEDRLTKLRSVMT